MKPFCHILILVSILGLFSCKKKEPEPALPAVAPTSNQNGYYGILSTGSYTNELYGVAMGDYQAKAYFSSEAVAAFNRPTSIRISNVMLNSDSLTYDVNRAEYWRDYSSAISSETWSITGNATIPSFTFVNTATSPSFTFGAVFPDSISKLAGFTVKVNNVTSATKGSVLVSDKTGALTGIFSASLNPGDNTITFTPANLTNLALTNYAYLTVWLENSQVTTVSGKKFGFTKEVQYLKMIKIQP